MKNNWLADEDKMDLPCKEHSHVMSRNECFTCGKKKVNRATGSRVEIMEYEIKTIDDFLKVPADRIDDCLAEFKTWYEVSHPLESLIHEVSKTISGDSVKIGFNRKFTWIDDGEKNISVILK